MKDLELEQMYDKETDKLRSLPPLKEREGLYIHHWVVKHCKKDDWVLDVGCGDGELLYFLDKKGYYAFGMDISPEAVKLTEDNLQEAGIKGANIKQAYIEKIPFINKPFDIVACNQVLEHVKDHKVAIKEMLRILKPGGKLLITVPIEKNFDCNGASKHLHYWDFYQLMHLFEEFGTNFKIYPINKFKQYNQQCDEPHEKNVFSVRFIKDGKE